jgi:RNA polymerase sigma-70 factor (ECF subfamily)
MDVSQTDEEVVRRVVAGEAALFGILVQRYEGRLRAYGHRFLSRREDIEDLVQDVFLKAYQNLRDFDPSRRWSPWIYRVAHNIFANALRSKARHPITLLDSDAWLPRTLSAHPETDLDRDEARRLLESGVNKLESKYREPLVLFYFDGLSYKEIAEVLRIPVATVGIRIARGRTRLKSIFQPLRP